MIHACRFLATVFQCHGAQCWAPLWLGRTDGQAGPLGVLATQNCPCSVHQSSEASHLLPPPRHQRGRTEPNLALYGHVWCWAAGGGPGGPYATITPPLLLGDWLAGGWGLSRHSWAGQCPGHVGIWAMLGELSLHRPPQLVAQSLVFYLFGYTPSLHLPLLWLLSKGGSEVFCPAMITGWTFRLIDGWQWAAALPFW